MKDINKLYPALNQILKSPRGLVLTVAFTTLLYSGLGVANNSTAFASDEQIQSSHSSIKISQNTGQFSTYSRIQISQNTNQISNVLPKRIANAILRDASKRSGVPIRELEIAQVTPKTFGNPCEFKFGEICTREYKPIKGWEAVVEVGDDSWTYHVNTSGSQILLDPKISSTKG
jgi:hypothetical protein